MEAPEAAERKFKKQKGQNSKKIRNETRISKFYKMSMLVIYWNNLSFLCL